MTGPQVLRREEERFSVASAIAAFKARQARIGIIGLGYVGIPLALTAAKAGFSVLGFDIDEPRVAQLNRGESIIKHISSAAIVEAIQERRFEATVAFERLAEPDAILICVPTPLTRHREPDLSFVEKTARAIAPHLRRGQLIVLESTTYPGTTDEVIKPILEASGLKSGEDFFLAFYPEREDPGNADFGTAAIPKVVGGDGVDALALANTLYQQFVVRTVPVSSTATAEAVKLTENIFRSVNIALVNELKVVYAAMGIDIWEVIEAAKTKPFGFMPFYPGPGLGGHCIPIDPFYLTWKAREFDFSTRFVELAGEVNNNMPYFCRSVVSQALNHGAQKSLSGSKVLVLGVAYKADIDDVRESPAEKLIQLLGNAGADVAYHDPYVPRFDGLTSVDLEPEAYDCVVIVTAHSAIDYADVVRRSIVVVDFRNATKGAEVDGKV